LKNADTKREVGVAGSGDDGIDGRGEQPRRHCRSGSVSDAGITIRLKDDDVTNIFARQTHWKIGSVTSFNCKMDSFSNFEIYLLISIYYLVHFACLKFKIHILVLFGLKKHPKASDKNENHSPRNRQDFVYPIIYIK
jgi:hypothetical protein